ncbi:MAG TPA: hypothetical protein VK966_00245 [Longimicrobiales bacterium]|nr:hypothetical protein [Longimicrobiales bacterium]
METNATRHWSTSRPPAVDSPDARPGVPMTARPSPAEGATWQRPAYQAGGEDHLHRAGHELTPVWGSAQPPHGLSGLMRRVAYRIPEHFARHWLLLLVADRVDVLEDRIGEAMAEPMERIGFDAGARLARGNPLAVLAGAVVGAWIVKKVVS